MFPTMEIRWRLNVSLFIVPRTRNNTCTNFSLVSKTKSSFLSLINRILSCNGNSNDPVMKLDWSCQKEVNFKGVVQNNKFIQLKYDSSLLPYLVIVSKYSVYVSSNISLRIFNSIVCGRTQPWAIFAVLVQYSSTWSEEEFKEGSQYPFQVSKPRSLWVRSQQFEWNIS